MADALKPCPCCGPDEMLGVARVKDANGWRFVKCYRCGLRTEAHAGIEAAEAAWNRRAPLAPLTEAEVEALARAIVPHTGNSPDDMAADGITVAMAWEPIARAALAAFVAGRTGG